MKVSEQPLNQQRQGLSAAQMYKEIFNGNYLATKRRTHMQIHVSYNSAAEKISYKFLQSQLLHRGTR